MIRNFSRRPYLRLLLEVLDAFALEDEPREHEVQLLKFEVLSPDAFMWRLHVGGHIYYVYAEDYITSLHQVRRVFDDYLGTERWSLVPARRPQLVNMATSEARALDQLPPDFNEFDQYAVTSGPDQVFLACSHENPQEALFADMAPSGFAQPAVSPEVARRVLVSQLVNAIKSARMRSGLGPGVWVNVMIHGLTPESEVARLLTDFLPDICYQAMAREITLGEVSASQPSFSRVGGVELVFAVTDAANTGRAI